MPVRGKRSIADTYVSILPETSRVASEIAKSFRATDREARQAGRRWRDEMTRELSDVRVLLNVDAAQARADAERLKGSIERMRPTMHVDIDHDRLGSQLSSAIIANLGRIPSQVGSQAQNAGQQIGGAISTGVGSAFSGGGDITAAIKAGLVASLIPVVFQLGGVASAAAGSLGLIPAALSGIVAGIGTVAIAVDGFGEALGNLRDPEKFAESLQSLAPNAQQAALSIQALLPVWDQLKSATSNALFANGAEMINGLAGQYMPAIEGMTTRIAGAINAGLGGVFDTLMRPDVQAAVKSTFDNIAQAFEIGAQAAAPFTQAFTQIIQVGSQFLPGIAAAITDVANRFSQLVSQAAADGSLEQWISRGLDVLGQLGGLVVTLVQDFAKLAPTGEKYLPKIISAVEGISNALVAATPIVAAFGPYWDTIAAQANVAADVMNAVTSFMQNTLGPVMSAVGVMFSTAWDAIGGKIETVWNVVKPILEAMTAAIGTLLGPLGTVLNLASKLPGLGDLNVGGNTISGTAVPVSPSASAADKWLAADAAAGTSTAPGQVLGSARLDQPGAFRRRDGSIGFAPLPQSSLVSPVPSGGYAVPLPPPPKASGSSSPAVAAYGLPAGSAIAAGGAGFPDWVYTVAEQFGVKAGTYAGHQEGSGFNRGIDWTGPTENLQRFAEYLATIPGELEQVIWQNPVTGQRIGVAGGQMVGPGTSQPGYYANDWAGHKDHVHTRQSNPIPMLGGLDMGLSGSPALAGMPVDGSMPSQLRDAYQRVQDRTEAVTRAQMRLDELNQKGTATALQRKTAEDALAKAQRERADAVEDLAKAQQKANETSGKGSGGSGDFAGLGQDLLGGMMQVFGFDGSLFADPSQFGITKLLSGLVNWGTQPAGDGSAGGLPGGAGGGSLLSGFIPQAFGALRLGGQDNGPVPFMGGMPGHDQGGSLMAGAQFAASSIHGAASQMGASPGPGNGNHYGDVINVDGGGNGQQVATNLFEQHTLPRARQAVRQQ